MIGNLRDDRNYMKLQSNLKSNEIEAIAVHANWMNGKDLKKYALSMSKLWIARRAGGTPGTGGKAGESLRLTKGKIKPQAGNWTCIEPSGPLMNIKKKTNDK